MNNYEVSEMEPRCKLVTTMKGIIILSQNDVSIRYFSAISYFLSVKKFKSGVRVAIENSLKSPAMMFI